MAGPFTRADFEALTRAALSTCGRPKTKSISLIRVGYGAGSDLMRRPSRVLGEIPQDLLDEWDLRHHG